MLRSTLRIGLALSLLVSLAGCGGTYVNIPGQAGDVASQNPNSSGVRQLIGNSVEMVISDANLEGPIALEMPEATSRLTHVAVAENVPKVIVPGAETQPTPAVTMEVTGVRIRGTQGEVDIRRPRSASTEVKQLVTAYGQWAAFSGWTVTRTRVWRGVADQG